MLFNALIRTHHITSRKKVSALKRAADSHNCFVLLRSGGCPGIMYVESKDKDAVEAWVTVVKKLRYKDFQLVARPGSLQAMVEDHGQSSAPSSRQPDKANSGTKASLKIKRECVDKPGLREVESVKEFGGMMEDRGIWAWWRKSMGYAS